MDNATELKKGKKIILLNGVETPPSPQDLTIDEVLDYLKDNDPDAYMNVNKDNLQLDEEGNIRVQSRKADING